MSNTVKCKKCGEEIELTEALQHQIIEKALLEQQVTHKTELEAAKKEAENLASKRVQAEVEVKMKQLQVDADEEEKRNAKLQEQILELTKEIRKVNQEKDDIKIEAQKEIAKEEQKIKEEVREKVEDEHRMKDAEKDKKLQDAIKVNEELKRKLEQGSQQTQGEVLELELEKLLKSEFPIDEIKPVAKGVRGADVIQMVMDKAGRVCGSILWESKNAKWSDTWIQKLKDDQREAKAEVAVLVSENLPTGITSFGMKNGVWIASRTSLIGLAYALRINIGQVYFAKRAGEGKNEKMEILYNYITGTEFKGRVEAIIEAFNSQQSDIEKEKRWFNAKWARQEKDNRRIIDNTYSLYEELQSVSGKALPEIKILELEGADDDETTN